MNDMSSSGGPSMYSSNTHYPSGGGGAGYYMDDYNQAYARPSFSSTAAPGIAGVGAAATAGAAGGYAQDNQQLRYRGQPQNDTTEDAYGGYTSTSPEHDSYAGGSAYASNQSAPYSRTTSSPPIPNQSTSMSPLPPPSYSGHGHGASPINEKARPLSSGGGGGVNAPLPMPPPNNMAYPPGGSGTPDESYDDKGRILRVANE
jgi:hypothetical protein